MKNWSVLLIYIYVAAFKGWTWSNSFVSEKDDVSELCVVSRMKRSLRRKFNWKAKEM